MKVLLIEDDQATADFISKGMLEQNYSIDHCHDGHQGMAQILAQHYDVAIVDRMLPGIDGLTLVTAIRAAANQTPVIFLSALAHSDDKVKGLQAGANDYLSKPFAFSELLIRVQLAAKQSLYVQPNQVLHCGAISLDPLAHSAQVGDNKLSLQTKEFQLLSYFLRHQEQVLSRTLLFEALWDYNFDPKTNVIDVHVAKLRKKLEMVGAADYIQTIRGAGYRFSQPV